MTTKGKVLVLVSSGHGLPLKNGKFYKGAGYYLNELTVPVRALMKEGYEMTFANPKGNTPQLDVNSAIAQFFGGDEAKLQDYLKFRDSLTGLKNPTRISDAIASGLDEYDAVFVPGGHGPMMDLLDDPDAGTVLRHFHQTSKPTAVLCHGGISLLAASPNSKEVVAALSAGDAAGARAKAQGWIYSGYKMTVFSTAEEQQREPLEIGGKVLFYPDFALSTAGADLSVLAPWTSYVLQDREVISGQNPFSDEALLKLLLLALDGSELKMTKQELITEILKRFTGTPDEYEGVRAELPKFTVEELERMLRTKIAQAEAAAAEERLIDTQAEIAANQFMWSLKLKESHDAESAWSRRIGESSKQQPKGMVGDSYRQFRTSSQGSRTRLSVSQASSVCDQLQLLPR